MHALRRRHVGGLLRAAAQAFERPDVAALVPLLRLDANEARAASASLAVRSGENFRLLRSEIQHGPRIMRHFDEMIFNGGQVPRCKLNTRADKWFPLRHFAENAVRRDGADAARGD